MSTQAKKNHLLVLGSGTSTGIPMINCLCKVCTSRNKKDKRLRTSLFIASNNGVKFLIDTTTDLRYQAIKYKLDRIDSVFITHSHADHIHGIDDLRQFCYTQEKNKIPIYTSQNTAEDIKNRFPYIFQTEKIFSSLRPIVGGGIPNLSLNNIEASQQNLSSKTIAGNRFKFCLFPHAYTESLAIIHSKFAYLPDCSDIHPQIIKKLKAMQLDLVIIDCLQVRPHKTHLNVDKCFAFIKAIAPAQARLIHMNHEVDHQYLEKVSKKTFNFSVSPTFD